MSLSRSAVYSAASAASVTSLSVTISAAPAAGDILIAACLMSNAVAQTPVTPSGWTQLGQETQGSTDFFTVYWKIATGAETTVAFVLSGGDDSTMTAGVAVYHGTNQAIANFTTGQRAGFDNITAADIGSVLASEWVICIGGCRSGGSTSETCTVSLGSNVETLDAFGTVTGKTRGIDFAEDSASTGTVSGAKFTWTDTMTFLYSASLKLAPGSLDFPLIMCM